MTGRTHFAFLTATLLCMTTASTSPAALVTVDNVQALRQAITDARPGTTILIAPGQYDGGMYFTNIAGEADKPIIISAEDPGHPPRIVGGGSGMQFSDAAYLSLRSLIFDGATGNGLNIDDGGSYETPSHHILLSQLRVKNVGPHGNRDGIKLSGVDNFRIEDCTIERWGDGGSGIDMVGCHHGVIENCRFQHDPLGTATGVQAKGGSRDVIIRANHFRNAGQRAVNIGGSTGLAYFRPEPEGYEAKQVRVEGNVFVGSNAPVAFVGVDGSVVRFNTMYHPRKWALRILQETREPGFVPSRNGVFSDNIVVFRSDNWTEGGVNIGPATAPDTFEFARNLWYCEDRPQASKPRLPTQEEDGIVGVDPLLEAPDDGDFSLQEGSPAEGKGHTALPEEDADAEKDRNG